ncbi:MAG TPA: AI-2E family transporter [Actinomycetota bacterium]
MNDDRNRVLSSPFVVRMARWGVVAWAAIGVAALVISFFVFVVYPVRVIFPPLVVALILVFLLNPIVSRFERRGVGRLWGSLLTYVVFLGLVVVGLRFLIPLLVDQGQEFGERAPDLLARLRDGLQGAASSVGIDLGLGQGGQQQVVSFLSGLLSFTRGLFHAALIVVLGPILAFYLLVDLPKIRRGLEAMIPDRRRMEVQGVARDLGRALGGFFRGQLLVSLVVGLASSLVLFIVGLPYWAVVGMVTGLFNLIPLIGPFIGGLVALVVAFSADAPAGLLDLAPGWPLALGSAIGLTIVQQVDNHILSPNIVARTVKLHPVTVMLALLAGGTLMGLWGMLLAVPVTASAKVLALHAWDTRMTWPPPSAGADPGSPPTPAGPAPPAWLPRWLRRRPRPGPAAAPTGPRAGE